MLWIASLLYIASPLLRILAVGRVRESLRLCNQPEGRWLPGVHLVFKYKSSAKRLSVYNDLRIEVQLRTRLQHAWATAVETVSTFTGQALKSNIGSDTWKRFFALVGSAFALKERRSFVPGTPNNKVELVAELKRITRELKIFAVLRGYSAAVSMVTPESKDDHIFLLVLDMKAWTIRITGFSKKELVKASEKYLEEEKAHVDDPDISVVLVSVESLHSLRSAYPNYYLDTKEFLNAVRKAIS